MEKVWDFDGWAERYDEVVASDSQLYARYDEVLDEVAKLACVDPGAVVLDVGTGTGNLAARFISMGCTVIGVGPSAKMLEIARRKFGGSSRANFVHLPEPFLRLPYSAQYFDAVVSTYAFHHVPHEKKFDAVREMVRALKKGGRLVVGNLMF